MLARAESLQSRDTIAQLTSALQQATTASDPPSSSSSSSSSLSSEPQQPQDDHAVTAAEVAALAAQVAEQSAMVCMRMRFVLFLKSKYTNKRIIVHVTQT